MENKFQTSFIPKKLLDDTGKIRVKTPRSLLSIFAVILIVSSLVLAGAVFAYTVVLKNKIEEVKGQVIAKEKEFNFDTINNIVRIDRKMKAVETLLNNHTAVSNLFTVLEENTLKNVRFTSFGFSYLSPTKIALTMKGQARTFGAVARQTERFSTATSTKAYFNDPLFSDFSLDEKGGVIFSFITTLDPKLIVYKTATTTTQ